MRARRNLGGSVPALMPMLVLVLGALLINCTTRPSRSVEPFHRAVLRGDLASVERMLATEPTLARARDEDGLTALHMTAVRLRVSPEARVQRPRARDQELIGDRACAPMASFTSYDRRDLQRLTSRSGAAGTFEPALTTTVEQRPMAELLIAHGAQVDARTEVTGNTPLHLAVRMGHKGVAEALLEHGADVNAEDQVGLTALGMAAQAGNAALARVLLDHGALVDRSMESGKLLPIFRGDTPLSLALVCNQRDTAILLLDRGADPNKSGQDGFRPLHLVESRQMAELLLARRADLEGRGYQSRTPLHQAAMQRRTAIVGLLLDRGADPNALDANGDTPLLLALTQPPTSADVIRALVERGANVNARRRSGTPALHAAMSRDLSNFIMLLDAGVPIDTADQYGRTALHWAVEAENFTLIELLLARGALINVKDATGHTPLYYTWGGSEGDRRIADLLRLHGGK